MKCNMDCFHCPYEDCINDELTAAEYRAVPEDRRERTKKELAIAARQREYREANKDAIAAYHREYYEANKDAIAARQREYREANKDAIAAEGRKIRDERRRHGYTQAFLARLLGVRRPTISLWESGSVPADWALLRTVLPETEKEPTPGRASALRMENHEKGDLPPTV